MTVQIINADVLDGLKQIPDESVHCVVTSPPYWGLRDYGTAIWEGGAYDCDHKAPSRFDYKLNAGLGPTRAQTQNSNAGSGSVQQYRDLCGKCGAKRADRQIGLEKTPQEFVSRMVEVFREVRRVLRKDGVCFVNLGDSYAGSGRGIGDTKTENLRNPSSRDFHDAMVEQGAIGRAWVKPPQGFKPKDLIGIPWRVALALQDDGWWLRQDIIWHKPNPMPESVTDRCTKAHEYIFLLTKSERYFWDADAIREQAIYVGLANQDESGFKDPRRFDGKHKDGYNSAGAGRDVGVGRNARPSKGVPNGRKAGNKTHKGVAAAEAGDTFHATKAGLLKVADVEWRGRNKRSVWTIATAPFSEAHFATFPPELPEICIKAGCQKGGTVLDPFGGAGTTGLVADRLQRNAILIELNPEYAAMARRRIDGDRGGLLDVMEAAE